MSKGELIVTKELGLNVFNKLSTIFNECRPPMYEYEVSVSTHPELLIANVVVYEKTGNKIEFDFESSNVEVVGDVPAVNLLLLNIIQYDSNGRPECCKMEISEQTDGVVAKIISRLNREGMKTGFKECYDIHPDGSITIRYKGECRDVQDIDFGFDNQAGIILG